jgi:hypothetical protein
LSEVQDQYFWDSDEVSDRDLESECEHAHWLAEWAHECQLELQSCREDSVL